MTPTDRKLVLPEGPSVPGSVPERNWRLLLSAVLPLLIFQLLAAALGRPIGFASSPEGSSLGAALLGMDALGMLGSLDAAADIVTVTDTARPDRVETEAYAPAPPDLRPGLRGARPDLR